MRKRIFVLLAAAAVLLISNTAAHAFGMGFWKSVGDKTSDWTSNGVRISSKMEHDDMGITLDTNLAKDSLFNYRLEFGKAEVDINPFFDSVGGSMEAEGLVMNHAFGFGMPITPLLRFWFGPELRITWVDGTVSNDPLADLDLFGFGFGAAAGLNINLPGPLTIGIKGGYSIMNYTGEGQYPIGGGLYSWRDYDVDQDLTYVTVMLMFRTRGDR